MNSDAFAAGGRVRLRSVAVVTAAVCALAVAMLGSASNAYGASDLVLTKSDNPDPVTVGAVLTYTIEVRNAGPDPATQVVVEDQLDNQLDFVSAAASDGSPCDRKGRKITCQLGTIAPNATKTVTIQVRPKREGTIANTATVTSPDDTTPGNNSETETTTVGPGGPSCAGRTATHLGTAGDDLILGTDRRDVIISFGGDDTIRSFGGNDIVCSKSGEDVVRGGSGGDLLIGGTGHDKLAGKSGNDVLRGKKGRDRLRGRGGSDRLNGGAGRDSCKGGGGRDKEKRCP